MSSAQPLHSGVLPAPQLGGAQPRRRWIWAAAILTIAWVAQGVLWTMWWGDPTHFKMSILFVWPAAIFALTIWWIFFSGWSWWIRLGCVASIVAAIGAFLVYYRSEWDGDMVPHFTLRSNPRAEEVARQFLTSQAAKTTPGPESSSSPAPGESTALSASGSDWTGFRGPHRDGVISGADLRRDWQTEPPRAVWRHPVGRAWSAFAVVGKFAFTQEQRDENECVVAYDADTGEQIWVHENKAILKITEVQGGPGPHGTPEFDDGLLYTLGGTGILNCLEATTGKQVWSTNILLDAGGGIASVKMPTWGVSNSPLIVDNLVVVIPGGASAEGSVGYDKGVAAYDKKSGKLVWSHGKRPASYGSAQVKTIAGTRQLLIPNANGLAGHSLETGEELWFYFLENDPKVNTAMPWALDDDSLLFGIGYGVGSVRIDIRISNEKWEATKRWASNRFRPKFNDFVVRDGYAYGLDDGTLCCLDVKNGAIKWKSGRYGYGQLLLVDDLLLLISEDGELMLIPASTSKPEVLASFKCFSSGFCWNQLALARGRVFARNANEAACLDVSNQPSTP